MMKYMFSPTTMSFYLSSLKARYKSAGTLPADVVAVSDDEHATYSGEPPEGMQRGADSSGRPTWVPIPPPNLNDLAARKRTEIDTALDDALVSGMRHTMPDDTQEVVQTRAGDLTNLLGLAIEARDLRDEGETAAVQPLRVQSNALYMLTPQQMIDVTDAAKTFKLQMLQRSWERKDAIDAILKDKSLTDDEKRTAIEAVTW